MSDERQAKTFLITGFGRSGTMFLAAMLSRSPTWTVLHEPAGSGETLENAAGRFLRQNHYGEVNSRLPQWLAEIPAGRKAVVLRDPWDIAVSVYNRHPRETPARLAGVWRLLDDCSSSYPVFRFEEFTNSEKELERIAEWAGIDDFSVDPREFQRPLNATRRRLAAAYGDIPHHVRAEIDAEIEWFASRHYCGVPELKRRQAEN